MIRFLVPALAAAAFSTSGQAGQVASRPTPASIEASIHQHGAEATIAALAKANQWDAVADRIGGGDARWIALAPKLAPGSDAGSAEDLGIALAFSLPKNPHAVLAALDPNNGHIFGASRVCGMPFIEDTVKDRPAYKRRALREVEKVVTPSLAKARATCLSELKLAS